MLDDENRVTYVGPRRLHTAGPFLDQPLWAQLPEAEQLLGPWFGEARATGEPVEFTVFYAGATTHIRAIPAPDGLAVHVERLSELDVRTLATLGESLRRIEAELAARAPVPHDRRAGESLRALP